LLHCLPRVNQIAVKKRLLRWFVYIAIVLLLLGVTAVVCLDAIVRVAAERHIRAETGLETSIGKFIVGLSSPIIRIENFKLKNTSEFGGDTFVDIPELHIEYDRPALRSGNLHLKLVRINVNQMHVVENEGGKRNSDDLQKRQEKTSGKSGAKAEHIAFTGIDTLEVTLGTLQFTSLRNPAGNMKQDLGIKNEVFKNLKTEKDFQTAVVLLTLKAGAGLWMSGQLTNLGAFLDPNLKLPKVMENISTGASEFPSAKTIQP
jgi:hypothetical protein